MRHFITDIDVNLCAWRMLNMLFPYARQRFVLRAAMFCGTECVCITCLNTNENSNAVQRKRQLILARQPHAFDEKVRLLHHGARHVGINVPRRQALLLRRYMCAAERTLLTSEADEQLP